MANATIGFETKKVVVEKQVPTKVNLELTLFEAQALLWALGKVCCGDKFTDNIYDKLRMLGFENNSMINGAVQFEDNHVYEINKIINRKFPEGVQ